MAKMIKLLQLTIFLIMISTLAQSKDQIKSRKLDQTTPPDLENKCGSCPCNTPCNTPPSPPPPSPPPPPKKKPPPSSYCPPPPYGGGGGGDGGGYTPSTPYIYINGPPGNLYPVEPLNSGSGRSYPMGLVPFLIIGALGLLAFG